MGDNPPYVILPPLTDQKEGLDYFNPSALHRFTPLDKPAKCKIGG